MNRVKDPVKERRGREQVDCAVERARCAEALSSAVALPSFVSCAAFCSCSSCSRLPILRSTSSTTSDSTLAITALPSVSTRMEAAFGCTVMPTRATHGTRVQVKAGEKCVR